MRILIDMDEVIADAHQQFVQWYERDYGIHVPHEKLLGTKLHQIVPEEHKAIVWGYVHTPGFFANLPVIDGSIEAVKKLNNSHEVYIVSAAMEFKHSLFEKYEWLDKYFPFIHWKRRIFCGDKSIIAGDVLIDDHDFNLSVFNGRKIMFTSSHNIYDDRYQRMHHWNEAEKILFEGESKN